MDAEKPIRVLVVEDSEEDLHLLRFTLEDDGMAVETAGSSKEARKKLETGSYEVLLVDLRLPDGDGLELLSLAREKDPHAVAIVLTAFASLDASLGALRRGAYDFLVKPCAPQVLAASVRRGAERHRLAKALEARTAEVTTLNRDLDKRISEATQENKFLNERLKRFIVQLMDANDARVKFMDNVTHELKNPLSVIWGHATHLLSRSLESWTKDEVAGSLKAMLRNAESLNVLLEELMDAARLSSQKIKLERSPVNAYESVTEIVESFRPSGAAKGIEIAAALGEGPAPVVPADKLRLRQILSNLISNALKFTPPGGRITVSAERAGSSAHFKVKDTGPGIPADALGRVFERHYQTEAGAHHKGLGLGLEISKGLVTLHGGTIWCESAEGKGATFHFTIPASVPDERSPQTPLPRIGRPH